MKRAIPFAIALAALCGCAKEERPFLDIDNMNYGWTSEFNPTNHRITFSEAWNGRGWIHGEENDEQCIDLSQYDRVVVSLDSIQGEAKNLCLIVRYRDEDIESRDMSTIVNGSTVLKVKLNRDYKKFVKSIFLLCETACEMKLTDAHLEKEHRYADRKELHQSEIGIISSDQFEGYSDNAVVEFAFETKGETNGTDQYGNTVDMRGWGVGMICSAADILGAELPTRGISFTNAGLQTYSCELGDLRYLLSQKDEDGECGIYWTVWKMGNINEAKILSTTIREVLD